MCDPLLCSAKGCQREAVWALVWNNPKVHTPDRRKSWLACEEHRQHLADFLGARQFLREVVPIAEAPADPGPAA
ncbi:MAG: acetone carboxylase [Nocardioides sp.]